MKIRMITAATLAALAIGSAYAAPSQTANLSVRVDGGTEVIGFDSPAAITDANASAIRDGTLTQDIDEVQIYTNSPTGFNITTTSQKIDGNGNPAIEQNNNFIPIALSYSACDGGPTVELLSRTNGSNQNIEPITTNLATNWSADACEVPGTAVVTYGGDGVEPAASATPYTGALTVAVAPI